MASYMDIFKQDPLAPPSDLDKNQLPQMSRNAPPLRPEKQEDYLGTATQMVANQAINKGAEKGFGYLKDNVYPSVKEMFVPAATQAVPVASSIAPAVSGAGAGLAGTAKDFALANAVAGSAPATTATVGTSAAGAAGAGGMAALGAAIPYIGMGLLAGKAFGLFNEGGPVYAQEGMPIGPLATRKIRYKREGGEVKEEFELSS